ncbi:MAG: hypothetical protein N2114_00480, partial [Candidatus Goldbacteria bacterium]|nr:hypothetical protein [Candidatus Goldiibacteriota bacterium]
ILIIILSFTSCKKNTETLEQQLLSDNPYKIKYAIDDVWRLNKTEYLTYVADLLSNTKVREHAAFALSLMASDNVDMLVLNRMNTAVDKTGHYIYFLLRKKKKKMIFESIKNNIKPDEKNVNNLFVYWFLTGELQKATEIFNKTENLDLIKKEFILEIGQKKERKLINFLKTINDANYLPLIKWALNKIEPKSLIKTDFNDKVITHNPYWKKYEKNPIMPTVENSFKSIHTANPDILVENRMIYFYYRGGDGNDRIAIATAPYDTFDGKTFSDYPKNPIISIGKDAFDDLAVLDPATLYFNKKVFLYYSGLGKGDDAIGLAVSDNFYNFVKYKNNPVLNGRAPEVLLKDGLIYLYFVLPNERMGYSIYLATSRDGYNFQRFSTNPVFTYGEYGQWDSKTVTTPRIREINGIYYMVYAGDDKYMDYPPFFGIAFSYDLINWYRSTQNPIFSRGAKGEWDDGGIWFAEVFPYKDKLYMYYEGWGGGESHEKEYGPGGHSQIGMAESNYKLEDML